MLILRDSAGLVLAITKEKRPRKPAALEKGKPRGARLLWEPGLEFIPRASVAAHLQRSSELLGSLRGSGRSHRSSYPRHLTLGSR